MIHLNNIIGDIKLIIYRIYIFFRYPHILKKKKIKVLFVLAELSTWKTEKLYISMLKHNRFIPIIGVTTSQEAAGSKIILENYLKRKNYEYIDLDSKKNILKEIDADFVFYYKPYEASYPNGLFFNKYPKSIPCSINYSFPIDGDEAIFRSIYVYSLYHFVENQYIKERDKKYLKWKGNNLLFTGVPMQDILMDSKDLFEDPWKDKNGKKRIIYAPHHSIPGTNGVGIEYATILKYGEAILSLAEKYNDYITIAFKPHPNLYRKLLKIWGQERTDSFYNKWETLENTQLEKGDYVGLFKHSDAIIHDSCSFVAEYLYMNKPALFLLNNKETDILNGFNKFGDEAFSCHNFAYSIEDIEGFISNVLNNIDTMYNKRKEFVANYLTPPNGDTASNNIIHALLREKPY